MARGVTYHSKKSRAAPFVNKVVVSGTFKKICGSIPPDKRINCDGKPDERRFARDITRPHTSTTNGVRSDPTEAMPSVAKREAFKLPSRYAFAITIDNGSM